MIEKYFDDVTYECYRMKPVLSFICSWEQGWILRKANKVIVSGPLFSEISRAPLWDFRT